MHFLPPNCWKSLLLLKKWPPPHFGSKWPKNDPPTPILGGHMTPPEGGSLGVKNGSKMTIFGSFFTIFSKKNPWISLLLFFKKKTLGFPYYFFSKKWPKMTHFWSFCKRKTHIFLLEAKKTIEFDNQKWPFFRPPKKVISCTPLNLIIFFGPPLNLIIKFGRPPKRGVRGSFLTHFWGRTPKWVKKSKNWVKNRFFSFLTHFGFETHFFSKKSIFVSKKHIFVSKKRFFSFFYTKVDIFVSKKQFFQFFYTKLTFFAHLCASWMKFSTFLKIKSIFKCYSTHFVSESQFIQHFNVKSCFFSIFLV